MSNSLKEILKPKTTTNNSNKTPKFYNEEKNRFIKECSIDSNIDIRMFTATNSHTPTKVLTGMLEIEQDKNVLKAVLLHTKIPRKSVIKFAMNNLDERVDWFENDEEVIAKFTQE